MAIFPGGSWSHTLSNDLEDCHRRYFYRVYASWGGWKKRNGPVPRLVYTAKNSRSIPMHVGVLTHDVIKRILQHLRAGHPLGTTNELVERIGERFVHEVDYSTRGLWKTLKNPKKATLILNDHLAGADVNPLRIEEGRQRCEDSLRAFCEHHLPRLLEIGTPNWKMIDSLDGIVHDDYKLFMAPDLVTEPGEEPGPGEEPKTEITDWKTGSMPNVEQLAIYALYWIKRAKREGKTAVLLEDIVGRSVPLRGEPGEVGILRPTQEHLDEAMADIEEDLAIMRQLHQSGLDRDSASFPKTPHTGMCEGCIYRFHCEFQD